MAASSPCPAAERKHWWLSNRKVGVAAPPWCISWSRRFNGLAVIMKEEAILFTVQDIPLFLMH
ncbi:hypothetical protein MUK42_20276 [Musa troglodytarum]|uniref:Uncharacterized protein n=1 Tax=Musa troglodytarum TaxID=320322 RepID=A0A9E7EMD6_9LILI|nr:hypothetical protein MUK42_20276 [Musa troglodytarum]